MGWGDAGERRVEGAGAAAGRDCPAVLRLRMDILKWVQREYPFLNVGLPDNSLPSAPCSLKQFSSAQGDGAIWKRLKI